MEMATRTEVSGCTIRARQVADEVIVRKKLSEVRIESPPFEIQGASSGNQDPNRTAIPTTRRYTHHSAVINPTDIISPGRTLDMGKTRSFCVVFSWAVSVFKVEFLLWTYMQRNRRAMGFQRQGELILEFARQAGDGLTKLFRDE